MECPNCHFVLEKKYRVCPSCNLPIEKERRKEDRRRRTVSPPEGVERRKGPRRSGGKDKIAWGI